MLSAQRLKPVFPIGILYFLNATISLLLARLDDGLPFLWLPTSLLIAQLRVRGSSDWWPAITICGVAAFIASGIFGHGWLFAGPMVVILMTEALVGVLLLNYARSHRSALGSLGWTLEFVIPTGIVAPGVAAAMMWIICSIAGLDGTSMAIQVYAAHALGNLIFTPLTRLATRDGWKSVKLELFKHGVGELSRLKFVVAAAATLVFAQAKVPILFLPFLPMILVAFRLGFAGSSVALVIVAAIGGVATYHGHGPIHLLWAPREDQMQFLQLYLASLALTLLPVYADLRNRAEAHTAMRLSEQRYRLLADHSTDIVLHLEPNGLIRYASLSITSLAGYEPATLLVESVQRLVDRPYRRHVRQNHLAAMSAPESTHSFEFVGVTASGERRWFKTHTRAIIDDCGQSDGMLGVVRDISARKDAEERLNVAAMTDPLTELPNRRAFEAHVAGAVLAEGRQHCVVMLDIDNFKQVNDRYGHDAGDAVLKSFADVLRRIVRVGDAMARLGGEEFAIFFANTDVNVALKVCDRVRHELGSTSTHCGLDTIRVTVSGGVATLGQAGLDEALQHADRALYQAKHEGRDRMLLAAGQGSVLRHIAAHRNAA